MNICMYVCIYIYIYIYTPRTEMPHVHGWTRSGGIFISNLIITISIHTITKTIHTSSIIHTIIIIYY